jgi:hypothetical protein
MTTHRPDACRLMDSQVDEPPVYYSSGERVRFSNATHMYAPYAESAGAQFRAYSSVADRGTYKSTFGDGLHLVLLHYVTKDVENFIAKRADRPVKWDVPEALRNLTWRDAELMAAYEAHMTYDGAHAICTAPRDLDYAGASEDAWKRRFAVPALPY